MRSKDRASHGPRARRLRGSIPAAGCRNGCEATAGQANREANEAPGLLSPQPYGLKAFVDFFRVARSGETAAGIDSLAPARLALTGLPAANLPKLLPQLRVAQRSRLQKSATVLHRPSWDLISVSLTPLVSQSREFMRSLMNLGCLALSNNRHDESSSRPPRALFRMQQIPQSRRG
jgi:hypothetical protein